MNKRKILISAYACEPGRGSEPGVGWNFVFEIAKHHDVWVITRSCNSNAIDDYLRDRPTPSLHFMYYDLPRWMPFARRMDKLEFIYYFCWQFAIFHLAKRVHSQLHFDISHHVTFATYWMPSLLGWLGIPFVWGPVGGGETVPPLFISSFGLRGRVYEKVRTIVHRLCEWNPFVVLTARNASVILASSPETQERISHLVAGKCAITSQVGIADQEFIELSAIPFKIGGPFIAFSAGVLTHYKAYHLSLSAFAEFHKENANSEYWLFGDGPDRGRLQAICRDMGIEKAVKFFGQVERGQYLAQISHCDVFLHPCLHESGGWAIAEALSAGRPVICLDLGGPSMQIEPQNGYKIKPQSPEYVISEMSRVMKYLANHLEFRHSLSQNAISRIEQSYLWSKKGASIAALYNDLLDH